NAVALSARKDIVAARRTTATRPRSVRRGSPPLPPVPHNALPRSCRKSVPPTPPLGRAAVRCRRLNQNRVRVVPLKGEAAKFTLLGDRAVYPGAMRDWWIRTLLVLQAPRPVFVALRDDSRESASERAEPVLLVVILAGIASVLATT